MYTRAMSFALRRALGGLVHAVVGLTLALWLATALAVAAPLPSEPVIRSYGLEDGLLQHSVEALAQTPDGYLWIGSGAGLFRFDGLRFVRRTRLDTPGLAGDRVRSLQVDPQGVLWIATSDGLSRRLVDGSFERVPGSEGRMLSSVRQDELGRVWAAAYGGVVGLIGPDCPALEVLQQRVASPYDLAFSGTGDVWVLDEEGEAWHWSAASHSAQAIGPIPEGAGLMVSDGAGGVLLGGLMGLHHWRDGAVSELSADTVTSIGPEVEGARLVGFASGKLSRLDRDLRLEPLATLPSKVYATFVDQSGGIWVGTARHGLLRLSRRRVATLRAGVLPGEESVAAVFGDSRGGLWASVPCSGARRYVGGVLERELRVHEPEGWGCVWSFAESPIGVIWVGTWGEGVLRYDLERDELIERIGSEQGVPMTALALAPRGDGAVWIGGSEGLVLWEDGRVVAPPGLAGIRSVIHLREDADGGLLIGTWSGLHRWDGAELRSWGERDGLPEVPVRDTASDGHGGLLLATYGAGLLRLSGGRVEPVPALRGLEDRFLSRIVRDRGGGLWLTGNSGLYLVSATELHRALAGEPVALDPITLGVQGGMPSAECNGGNNSAGFLDRDGVLYAPTLEGVALVDTTAVRWQAHEAPSLRIEEVRAGELLLGSGLALLPPGRRDLQVRYTAFHFPAPEELRFRYRLDGGPWGEAGARRVVDLLGFEAGEHRFEVQARVFDGPWSDSAVLPFVAPPAWHERGALRLLALLALLGLLVAALAASRARERRVQALVEERTHELAEANRKLAEVAHADGLTGVATRRRFEDMLPLYWKAARRASQPISLLMIDLDGFKALNDSHGHPAGDRCLVEVAARLGAGCQRDLDLVARYGGDEFAVLLPDSDADGALTLAERMHAAVRALRIEIPAVGELAVTLSIGVATLWPEQGGLPADLVDSADRALYLAKAQGRDRVVRAD